MSESMKIGDITAVLGRLDMKTLKDLAQRAQAEVEARNLKRMRTILEALYKALKHVGPAAEDTMNCGALRNSARDIRGVQVSGACALGGAELFPPSWSPAFSALTQYACSHSVEFRYTAHDHRNADVNIVVTFQIDGLTSIPGLDEGPCSLSEVLQAYQYLQDEVAPLRVGVREVDSNAGEGSEEGEEVGYGNLPEGGENGGE